MINDYNNWLKEKGKTVAIKFIEEMKKSSINNIKYEDWWSISERDYENEDIAYIENLERIERNKPEEKRFHGQIYYIELRCSMSDTHTHSHTYKLIVLNTITFDLEIHNSFDEKAKNSIEKIYDNVLKEMHFTEYIGKKYNI